MNRVVGVYNPMMMMMMMMKKKKNMMMLLYYLRSFALCFQTAGAKHP